MEDQVTHVDKEQGTLSDADLAMKLSKKERRLSERLLEAQEDEVRAHERFQRAQARLQRRRDRVERLKSHLALVQQQLTDLYITRQQREHVEPQQATSESTLLSESEEPAPAPFEPEAHVLSDTGSESDTSATNELEVVATPEPEVVAASPTAPETASIIEPEAANSPTASETATILEPEAIPPSDTSATTEPEGIALSPSESDTSTTLEPEVDATPEIDSSSDSTSEREPTKPLRLEQETQPGAGSLSQDVQAAKAAWVQAESAMQQARNTAHGIAASISFLARIDGLSNELMTELMRKQGDANKVLLKAQDTARLAYDRFVQAQENAEHASSQQVEIPVGASEDHTRQEQENGALPVDEEDNANDQTVRMHAIHLHKM